MGIKGAHKLLTYCLNGVTMTEVVAISRMRCEENHVGNQHLNITKPMILDVDVSWLFRRSAASGKDALEHTILICLEFVRVGFIVVLICDGSTRHHTKRATIERKVKRYKIQMQILEKRKELMLMADQRRKTDSVKEKHEIESKELQLSNSIKRMETGFQSGIVDVGQTLYDNLKDVIESLPDEMIGNLGGHITVCQAKYQADSVIAYRCNKRISDLVLGNDTDLAAHCGSQCLGVKDFKFNNNKISDMELFSACYATICQSAQKISVDVTRTNERLIHPPHPVFEGINNPKTRSLIAIGLGCDVCIKNIKAVTPKSLHFFMNHLDMPGNENQLYDQIMTFYVSKHFNVNKNTISDMDYLIVEKFKSMIEIYIEAFMFEPATFYAGDEDEIGNNETLYIHEFKPLSLHKYIKDFAEDNNQITIRNDNIPCGMCVGPGDGSHCYLCDNTSSNCTACRNEICSTCCFTHDNRTFCVECYLSEKEIPNTETDDLSVATMRNCLTAIGLDVAVSDSVADIIDWYEALIIKDHLVYKNSIVLECSMPMEDSAFMSTIDTLCTFDIKEGGRLIRNESIPILDRMELLGLLSDLVSISTKRGDDATETYTHSVIPTIIINYANNARLSKGYRLVKRCIRHALDPRAISILHAVGKVIKYKNEIGILIQHKIKASMKSNIYEVSVCFTRSHIVSCSCTCKAGSVGIEKVMCVHVLPVVYQYTLLLFDGLSEHILCELANAWNNTYEKALQKEQRTELLYYLNQLKQSTGVITNHDNNNMSVTDFLKAYSVGTESMKLEPPPPQDQAKLGPLRYLDLRSPIQQALLLIKKKNVKSDIGVSNSINQHQSDTIDNADLSAQQEEPDYESDISVCKNINQNLSESFDNADLSPDQEGPDYSLISMYLRETILMLPSEDTSYTIDDFVGYQLTFIRNTNSNTIHSLNVVELLKEALDIADDVKRGRVHSVIINNKKKITDNNNSSGESRNTADKNNLSGESSNINESNKRSYHNGRCCFLECTNKNEKLVKLPPIVKEIDTASKKLSETVLKTYYRKSYVRREWLTRIGLDPNDRRKDLRICVCHPKQKYSRMSIPWINNNGCTENQYCDIIVPLAFDEKQSLTRSEKRQRNVVEPTSYNNKRTKHRQSTNVLSKRNQRCAFIKCSVKANSSDPSIKFRSIPPAVAIKTIKSKNTSHMNSYLKRIAIKKYHRNEYLRRIGSTVNDTRKDIRICCKHPMEILSRSVEWIDCKNTKQSTLVKFPVPAPFGLSSVLYNGETPTRDKKGVGRERQSSKYMSTARALSESPDNADLSWGIMFAENLQNEEDAMKTNLNGSAGTEMIKKPDYIGKICCKAPQNEKTCVRISNLEDSSIRNDTGFKNKQMLICFIIVACNGDIARMCSTVSRLTWFEEWYFVFEKIWARASQRYCDGTKQYKKAHYSLRNIYDSKIKIILKARSMWPIYATMKEDEKLRNVRWNKHYSNKRVVMWDNTSICMHKPANSEAQRNTYSSYYANNVGKGAVFVQLCGWMGTHELWMGAVSDSEYMIRSGILEQQNDYVPKHDPAHKDVPFINILDKGYRIVSAAWRIGGQFVLQPAFAKCDQKFNTVDVIRSAAVASDRGGNERAVRISKLCGSIKKGLYGYSSPARLCDLWLAWSFQANFMFKKVV